MSLMALKSRVNLALALRSTRGTQLSLISIGVTLSYLEGLLKANLAALFWTDSSSLMSESVWGSHTVQQYSIVGLTYAWYSLALMWDGHVLKFL